MVTTTYVVYRASTRNFGGNDRKNEFDTIEEAQAFAIKHKRSVTGIKKVETTHIDRESWGV